MLKSIAQVKTFVNEVVNAESTAHILSNRGRNMRPLLTFVIMKFFLLTSWLIFSAFPCDTFFRSAFSEDFWIFTKPVIYITDRFMKQGSIEFLPQCLI